MDFNKSMKYTKEPTLPKVPKISVLDENVSGLFEGISFKNQELKESILDPINDHLCSDIFDDKMKMKEPVRNAITSTFIKWWKKMGFEESQIIRFAMIGSSAGYQYSKSSDIDVNVQVNISESNFNEIWKMLPNGNNLLKTAHPINYYLITDDQGVKDADSAYDVLKDKWIKEPKKSEYKAPYNYGLEIAKFFMYGIDNKIAELDRDIQDLKMYKEYLNDKDANIDKEQLNDMIAMKETEIKADLDSLGIAHHLARSFRQEAFENGYEPKFLITIKMKGPNESLNNVVYKILERYGYFDKITKYDALYDKYDAQK